MNRHLRTGYEQFRHIPSASCLLLSHKETDMKTIHLLPLALALTTVVSGNLAWAAQHDQHTGHHPVGAAPAPASEAAAAKPASAMARMDKQTKTMGQMHHKMLAARTPEERNAVMAEHMKTMQDGMSMMNEMSHGGPGSMKGDMATRQQMMEKHMAMMGATMQMMMDRLPAAPVK